MFGLFSFFKSLSFFHTSAEKIPMTNIHCNQHIDDVVEMIHRCYSTTKWLELLQSDRNIHIERLAELESCQVTRIEHHRERTGLLKHEFIVVFVESPQDRRCIRLDRFPKQPEYSTQTKIWAKAEHTSTDSSTLFKRITGIASGQGDTVNLIDNKIHYELMEDKYGLVQSVAVPRGKIDVIDVAALAATITSSAEDYSLRHYMCWWWSAVFFSTIVSGFNLDAAVKQGPLSKDRAQAAKFTFIDEECELVLPKASEHDRVAAEIAAAEGSSFSMVELMNEDMKDDARKMREKRQQDPQKSNVMRMVVRFDNARSQCRELIRAKVDAKIRDRDKSLHLELVSRNLERDLEESRQRELEAKQKEKESRKREEQLRRELEKLRGMQTLSPQSI